MRRLRSLFDTTAIEPAILYLAFDVWRKGDVPHLVLRQYVVFEIRLTRRVIQILIYQAHDVVRNKLYPLALSPAEAMAFALLAGNMNNEA